MSSNKKILDLYTDKLIMGEIKFAELNESIKEDLEQYLITIGLGYLSLDEREK